MTSDRVRVLIADDHAEFRDGMTALLGSDDEVEVVGAACDGAQAVEMAARLQPDVVLMDLGMPVVNGVEATRQLLATSPHISVLVISMQEDSDSVFAALQAGARGYLLKGAMRADILRSIKAVVRGDAIFGPAIARRLMQYFAVPRTSGPETFPELTEREREILALVARHETNPEIARQLELSPKTVRNHVSNIFTKLQVADRAQAIIRAREGGLGARED